LSGRIWSWNTTTNKSDIAYATARALGLRAKIDTETGWHKTLSNVGINGVTGITASVFWDLQATGTDADLLNKACVTTLIRKDGFKFWGSRTCSDDPLFQFENTPAPHRCWRHHGRGPMWAVDRPVTPTLVRDMIDGIKAKFRELKSAGLIIDGDCWYDASANDKDTLKAGKLFMITTTRRCRRWKNLTLRQRITDRYLATFAASVNR
jgi:uncharacterized protein